MSITADPINTFIANPTFTNLLEATSNLFTRTLFAVLGLVIKVLRVSFILTIFVAIHVIPFIDALLILFVVFASVKSALAAVYPLLADFMDTHVRVAI